MFIFYYRRQYSMQVLAMCSDSREKKDIVLLYNSTTIWCDITMIMPSAIFTLRAQLDLATSSIQY